MFVSEASIAASARPASSVSTLHCSALVAFSSTILTTFLLLLNASPAPNVPLSPTLIALKRRHRRVRRRLLLRLRFMASSSGSASSYLCPACASPNFNFFDVDSEPNRAIDKTLALVLLCAAKISAASMTKAVIVARAEAERRVREAALAGRGRRKP
ncbi:hypothetical protein F8388_009819 [Cannabis sativa]|uniref:Uncharacterized protein n=1 Tax=Cannabis sativa TaxID=3483 RepID=A0A7J6H344_CANSA|nr:hypothetical protein F8388_009819 [Cannabis sativa]